MPYQTCIDCGTREHSRCYNSTAVRINHDTGRGAKPSDQRKLEELTKPINVTGTGDTVVDREVIRRIVKLNDYLVQHNYCIKELTEMVMDLDKRLKKQGDGITTWYDLAMHQDQRIKKLEAILDQEYIRYPKE